LKVVVVRSEEGKIVSSEVLEGDIGEIVRRVAEQALKEWNPLNSDFTVLRAQYELRYPTPPPDPGIVDIGRELGLEMMREGNELVIIIPIYTISFDNSWMGDAYMDRKMYVVAVYLDELSKKQVEEYAAEATKEPKRLEGGAGGLTLTEDQLKALEEGLKELEEEKPKKRRRRRKKS